MAKGSSVSLEVQGAINNLTPAYGFKRNGKQFYGTVKKGWNTELQTDEQRINAVKFRNSTLIAGMISRYHNSQTQDGYKNPLSSEQETALNNVINYEEVLKGYTSQAVDDNGYYSPHAELQGYAAAVVAETIRSEKPEALQTLIEGLGKKFYAETIEGYNEMKADKNIVADIVKD